MRGSELSALVAGPKLEDFLGGISAFSEQNHKDSYNMIPTSSSSSACYANSAVTAGYQLYHQPRSALQFADSVTVASSDGVHDGSGMLSAATANGGAAAASGNNGGSIGLSMIKNWLRSQPAPPQPRLDAADGARASQGLSLSMNMAGTRGAGMPLAGERGRAPESVSTTASVQGGTMAARKEDTIGGSGGAGALIPVSTDTGGCGASADAVARKTVDTFGQRTSIYRGVTR
jgi:AP2-like factor, ANT lineage